MMSALPRGGRRGETLVIGSFFNDQNYLVEKEVLVHPTECFTRATPLKFSTTTVYINDLVTPLIFLLYLTTGFG